MGIRDNVIKFVVDVDDKASASFNKLGKGFQTMASSVVKAGVVVTGAVLAVEKLVEMTARGADENAKFASRLGIATEGLTRYQHAAELSGVSTRNFNLALQRLNRRAAEVVTGTGVAKDAFEKLGISAAEFTGMDTETQLITLADAFEKVEASGDKVLTAFKLFDTEGVGMLQLFADGSKEMRKLAEDADFLGLTLSATTAVKMEGFMDSLTRIKGAFTGTRLAIADELAPALTALNNMFANFIANNRQGSADMARSFVEGMLVMVLTTQQAVNSMSKSFDKLFSVKGFSEVFTNILAGFRDLIVGVIQLQIRLFPELMVLWVNAFKNIFKTLYSMGKAFFTGLWELAKDPTQTFKEAVTDNVVAAFRASMDALAADAADSFSVLKAIVIPAAEGFSDGVEDALGVDMDEIRARVKALLDEWGVTIESVKQGLGSIPKAGEEHMSALQAIVDQAARNMQTAMADFFFEPFENGLKGMLKSFIDIIRRMVAEIAAANFFASSWGVALTTALGGSTGTSPPKKAWGGSVTKGMEYIVGDEGPERWVAPATGSIIPNGKGGSSGQQVVQFNTTINGGQGGFDMAVLNNLLDRRDKRLFVQVKTYIDRRGVVAV